MPNLNLTTQPGVVDLSDAPASLDDATFDSLFPSDATTVVTAPTTATPVQTTPQPTTVTAQPTPPTPPNANQPFIKGDKSVYNTPEAAIQGINQKDALIETMRQRYALVTGLDPITGQPVANSQNQSIPELNYSKDPKTYMKDLYAAAQATPEAYRDVQQKFISDTLEPLKPMIQKIARQEAIEKLVVDPSLKDAGTFIGTPAYQQALDSNPELKNAIATAEGDMNWHSRLPGLYKIAYLTGRGQQLPELIQQQPTAAVPPQPTAPVRSTAQPTTISTPTVANQPSFKNLDGIRATIAAMEAKGMKLDF